MAHDFKKFPELRNEQMIHYYFQSPHKQIFEDFWAEVVKVVDGDTIRVKWHERDFDFPLRLLDINAPEMNEPRGEEVRGWLKGRIEGEEVEIRIDPKQRVGKWGRLLGKVFHGGMDIGEVMISQGMATTFEGRNPGKIPDISQTLKTF